MYRYTKGNVETKNNSRATLEQMALDGWGPRHALFWALVIVASISLPGMLCAPAGYMAARKQLIEDEQARRIGGTGAGLTAEEKRVSDFLIEEKRKLVEDSRINSAPFPGKENFLKTKHRDFIRQSPAYKVIESMPKGGVLHVHDEAITSIDWLVKNVTYRDHLYLCEKNSNLRFKFSNSPPVTSDCSPWTLVKTARANSRNAELFDRRIHASITMVTDEPSQAYPDVNSVWNKFMDYFGKVEGLMLYAPVFEDYLYEGLKEFRQDNVQYLEIRGLLPPVYELDGSTHDMEWVLDLYKRVNDRFVMDFPDFTGFKFIQTSLRFKNTTAMLSDIAEALCLHQKYPEFMVGFDLVGQEDRLNTLLYYLTLLRSSSGLQPTLSLPYFFHAGETNWAGSQVDYNLLDALLLNTKRIGHGYALSKHPLLLDLVKERDVAVEVNPISNQVLQLVDDLRNHPAASLLADNFAIVISSDDPPAWEAKPLSDDFYLTFTSLLDQEATLSSLKQLARNSLQYSALSADEKKAAISQWEAKWKAFITKIIKEFQL